MSLALLIVCAVLALLAVILSIVDDDRRSQRIREATGEERFRFETN